MKIEDRLARLEADFAREINAFLLGEDREGALEVLELLPGAEVLAAMSGAELHRLASGDCSFLTAEQREQMSGPVPPEAVEVMRRRKARTWTPLPKLKPR